MNFRLLLSTLLIITALVVPSSLIYSAEQPMRPANQDEQEYPESEDDEDNYMGDPMIEGNQGDVDEDTDDFDESDSSSSAH